MNEYLTIIFTINHKEDFFYEKLSKISIISIYLKHQNIKAYL